MMKYPALACVLLLLVSCSPGAGPAQNESVSEPAVNATVAPPSAPVSTRGDLAPKIYPKTSYPEVGSEIEIKLAVQNMGVERIKNRFDYKVSLSKDGAVLYEKSGDYLPEALLPAEEAVIHSFSYKFSSAGEYELNLLVDTKGMLSELDESNNNKSITLYAKVKAPEEEEKQPAVQDDSGSGCSDSDSGKDLNAVGICTDSGSFKSGKEDFCVTDEKVAEMYCENSQCRITVEPCGNGLCKDGRCI